MVYSSDNIYDLVYGKMLKGAKQMSEKRYINYREWWNEKGHLISDKRECALEAWDTGLNANYEEDLKLQQKIEELAQAMKRQATDQLKKYKKIKELEQENQRLKEALEKIDKLADSYLCGEDDKIVNEIKEIAEAVK